MANVRVTFDVLESIEKGIIRIHKSTTENDIKSRLVAGGHMKHQHNSHTDQ